MTLKSIRLTNVRRFTNTVEVRGIGPGLNLLTAPNEYGKSTVFDALRAAFFWDYKSRDRRIRSLTPYAGGNPEVGVEFELNGEMYCIRKCWKRGGGLAEVYRGHTLFRQAEEAEEWLKGVLQPPESGGPAGLLWVHQGQSGFSSAAKKERDNARTARRTLLTSVSDEVDAMTGGRRMEIARKTCSDELAQYLTGTGRVKLRGPLAQSHEKVNALEAKRDALEKVSRELRKALSKRRRCRDELSTLEDPREDAKRRESLETAKQAHEAAQRHADQLGRAKAKVQAKQHELARVRDKRDSMLKSIQELKEAQNAHRSAEQAFLAASEDLVARELPLAGAAAARKKAEAEADTAREVLRRATLKERLDVQLKLRSDLANKLEEAKRAREALETAQADKTRELSARDVEEIERQDLKVKTLLRSRDTNATGVTMAYLEGRKDGVALDGNVLEHGVRVPIPDGAVLDIEGIGQLTVHPGQRADNTSLEEAQRQLKKLLNRYDLKDIKAARISFQRRKNAEECRRDADAVLRSVAPDGVATLQEELARLPVSSEELEEAPPHEEAAAAEEQARRTLDAAIEAHDQQRNLHAEANKRLAQAGAAVESAQSRLDRAQLVLQELEPPEKEFRRLETTLANLSEELQALVIQYHAFKDSAPEMVTVSSRFKRARSALQGAQEQKEHLRLELRELDVIIREKDGGAVEENLKDVIEQLELAEAELRHIQHEVQVLQRLKQALDAAQESARDRYVAPVIQELRPLIRRIWPEARIRFDANDLLPETLVREGTEEEFDVLSGGTQEQIALLVRLAFARILASSGSPAPVILDDAIVYTDDHRIETLFDALTDEAHGFQIIVLSCRQMAFMGLGGQNLHIRTIHAD